MSDNVLAGGSSNSTSDRSNRWQQRRRSWTRNQMLRRLSRALCLRSPTDTGTSRQPETGTGTAAVTVNQAVPVPVPPVQPSIPPIRSGHSATLCCHLASSLRATSTHSQPPVQLPVAVHRAAAADARSIGYHYQMGGAAGSSIVPAQPPIPVSVQILSPPPELPRPLPVVAASVSHQTVHTQIDYIHCLVPNLTQVFGSPFYWGVIDRYVAEEVLDSKPEGTFLLRDSAQEEFLFSVSFRRYQRSLHARVEQWSHRFSFDAHDPGVFSADTLASLLEHYKDPFNCMFFEPMLTVPLPRRQPFSLQVLSRAVICDATTYDGINHLHLPARLKDFLKVYHYKQRLRVRRLDCSDTSLNSEESSAKVVVL